MTRMIATLLSGLLILLPVVITIVLVVWLGTFIYQFVGPGSVFGHLLTAIGLGFSTSPWAAYLIGMVVLITAIYFLGLLVETRLERQLSALIDWVMMRIPLVSNVYDLTKRFVALMDRKQGDGLKSMSPVWCFFGGDGGVAVLALLPTPEVITIGGEKYHTVLVPSAPVPVGGALVYVPTKWVQPAQMGVEELMTIYVSMGVSAPKKLPAAALKAQPAAVGVDRPTLPQPSTRQS
jgi:uncharacterized membrane protein